MKKVSGRNPHNRQLWIDIVHIVIGCFATAITVFAFMDLDSRMGMFPFVFVLAALLNFINGIPRLGGNFHQNTHWKTGVMLMLAGVFLLAFAALSAYTLWR